MGCACERVQDGKPDFLGRHPTSTDLQRRDAPFPFLEWKLLDGREATAFACFHMLFPFLKMELGTQTLSASVDVFAPFPHRICVSSPNTDDQVKCNRLECFVNRGAAVNTKRPATATAHPRSGDP